jgi:glycosyltransferase involved in cell wall biosynthesis
MNRVIRACMRRYAGGRNVMLATGEGDAPPAPGISWIFATALSAADLRRITPRTDGALARPPQLIYAGRLSHEKGVDVLVHAIAQLAGEGTTPIPRLTVAGDGPERAPLESLARTLGCAACITFAGQLDRDALSRQLSAADLCVQPSRSEGYSKAWLDAFAHGLPVLTSRVGAAERVIGGDGERGWLVPPDDVPALTATLARVLGGGIEWAALRRRCRSYVEGRTVDAWARRIAERCAEQWRETSMARGRVIA